MDIQYKICTKCKKEKPLSEFSKDKSKKDGLKFWCKSCDKQWRENNKDERKQYLKDNTEKIKQQQKQYYQQNKNKLVQYSKQYRKDNEKEKKQYEKQYNNRPALFDTYADQIKYAEKVKKSKKGHLEIKCTYCGKWFEPSNKQIKNRIQSLNGRMRGENRFYCSNTCKKECSIYYQSKYAKDQNKSATLREVQPKLRQMVFKRDNWTCIKCNSTESLHCHHITGIELNPIESADIDNCITLCKKCHKEVHKQKGCRYSDLRRNKCQ